MGGATGKGRGKGKQPGPKGKGKGGQADAQGGHPPREPARGSADQQATGDGEAPGGTAAGGPTLVRTNAGQGYQWTPALAAHARYRPPRSIPLSRLLERYGVRVAGALPPGIWEAWNEQRQEWNRWHNREKTLKDQARRVIVRTLAPGGPQRFPPADAEEEPADTGGAAPSAPGPAGATAAAVARGQEPEEPEEERGPPEDRPAEEPKEEDDQLDGESQERDGSGRVSLTPSSSPDREEPAAPLPSGGTVPPAPDVQQARGRSRERGGLVERGLVDFDSLERQERRERGRTPRRRLSTVQERRIDDEDI